ncbi:MAG: type IV toxin-antitoxin system AbiEi family antitoxin domain-containing protein [Brevundimonas sp.]|uniref:type IV toxin-antitoxin system AbiEi family antitoxin domain-containing protein n=1 Tax=Brevundimonas sp. TaxID=1871086 RepID=UPI001840F499|nr:type IV toxin-antitoxin system AbiEi family antitoxin domain-containing protein [Brevundimonas sp.]MBA4804818.1 type IV toxin-antitoxin system AbiEi family antitoxin domain-containing protein [Brevundimonas sp.]
MISNIVSPPDARTLVLDLFAAHPGGRFTTAELVRAGGIFGLSPTAVRTAVARLRREGRLAALSRGVYAAGPAADAWRRRVEGWRDAPGRRTEWRGGWLMAAARPSSLARTAWRATLRALEVEGFRQTRQGLWLRPDNLVGGLEACRTRLIEYGAAPGLMSARLDALDPGSARAVPGLWDAAALAEARRALLERLRQSLERLHQIPADAAARESLTVGRSAVRAIVRDPLLPDEWEDAPSLADLVAAMEPYQGAGRAIWLAYLGRGASTD